MKDTCNVQPPVVRQAVQLEDERRELRRERPRVFRHAAAIPVSCRGILAFRLDRDACMVGVTKQKNRINQEIFVVQIFSDGLLVSEN